MCLCELMCFPSTFPKQIGNEAIKAAKSNHRNPGESNQHLQVGGLPRRCLWDKDLGLCYCSHTLFTHFIRAPLCWQVAEAMFGQALAIGRLVHPDGDHSHIAEALAEALMGQVSWLGGWVVVG